MKTKNNHNLPSIHTFPAAEHEKLCWNIHKYYNLVHPLWTAGYTFSYRGIFYCNFLLQGTFHFRFKEYQERKTLCLANFVEIFSLSICSLYSIFITSPWIFVWRRSIFILNDYCGLELFGLLFLSNTWAVWTALS